PPSFSKDIPATLSCIASDDTGASVVDSSGGSIHPRGDGPRRVHQHTQRTIDGILSILKIRAVSYRERRRGPLQMIQYRHRYGALTTCYFFNLLSPTAALKLLKVLANLPPRFL